MYRLLIADDEMIERKVLFKTLSQNLKGQCEIFQAENGREALEIDENYYDKIEKYMKKKRSRSPYWILKCQVSTESRQQSG